MDRFIFKEFMKIKRTITLLLVGTALFAVSCGDSGNGPSKKGESTGMLSDGDKAKLYDKLWEPTSSAGGLVLEFRTGGEFVQAYGLVGSWSWENKGDTMNLTDYSGKKFQYLFDQIGESSMTFRSNVGGDNFKTPQTYKYNP